jgi:steroid delta-isomerase-like uncharacterized protein
MLSTIRAAALSALVACASTNTKTTEETTMTTANAQTARRYFEDMWNHGDPKVADELIAADVVGHVNNITVHGREVLRQRVGSLWAAYSELHFDVQDVLVADDRAVVRWTFRGRHTGALYGSPGTGRSVSITGMNMFRLAGGRIAEIWVSADDLGELEQLGLIRVPTGAGQ